MVLDEAFFAYVEREKPPQNRLVRTDKRCGVAEEALGFRVPGTPIKLEDEPGVIDRSVVLVYLRRPTELARERVIGTFEGRQVDQKPAPVEVLPERVELLEQALDQEAVGELAAPRGGYAPLAVEGACKLAMAMRRKTSVSWAERTPACASGGLS